MSEFRRIMMSSFLMLLLHFTAADVKDYSRIVRAGDEVTLPCYNVTHDQDKCENTIWLFSDSRGSAVTLFEHGKTHNDAKAKPDRLRVTEKCSLVIKKVTEEDAGRYSCRQFSKSGKRQGSDSPVYLSVVTMTEHQDDDEVTFNCSLKTYGGCRLTVKWLLLDRDVDTEIKTSQSSCSASVTFLTSHFSNTPRSELFTCEVTDGSNVQTFRPQSSGEDKKSATTTTPPPATPTTTPPTAATTTTTTVKNNINSGDDAGKVTTVSPTWTTVRMRPTGETTNTASENDQTEQEDNNKGWWRWIIVVIVAVAALTIITVAVIRRKRTQGTDTQTDDNVADPEDGVSYASISYTKKSSRAHLHDDDDDDEDEDDAVTYSTVGAPSSSSAASADPSLLYATVNKPRKKPIKVRVQQQLHENIRRQQRSSQHVEVTPVLSH